MLKGVRMVSPGKNLDFEETDYYAAKLAPAIALANAITEHLKSWPSSGAIVCGKVRQFQFKMGGQVYVVLYCRNRQVIGLMNIFEMPGDKAGLKAYLETVHETDQSQKSRRKS